MDNRQGHDTKENLIGPATNQGDSAISANGPSRDEAAEPAGIGPWLTRNGAYLLLMAAAFLLLRYYFDWDLDDIQAVVIVVLGLGAIIFIHELGHFLVAKWCDVHVQTFSIGFGPALPGCKFQWGETTYKIALFPLGGYVKMVGEGPDTEESENDPRSFRNKPVWQRMVIISAGVTMNLIFGFACFVFVYMTHGEERAPGVIGLVEPGSPAWEKGLKSGDVIYRIGDERRPYFDNLMTVVLGSDKDEQLPLVYGPPDAKPGQRRHIEIQPRRDEDELKPMIGVRTPEELKLLPPRLRRKHALPVQYGSAAARSEPPFEFGDAIVGTTDPDHLDQVSALPPDPRHPGHPDFFAFEKRMQLLAGKPVVIEVRRGKPPTIVNISVPPAYHYVTGWRMRMGKITAIRDKSPAAKARVQINDIITKVEINDPEVKGGVIRFVAARSPKATLPQNVKEKNLDPERLPFELNEWAKRPGTTKEVILTLLRKNPPPGSANAANHKEDAEVTCKLLWQTGWRFSIERPRLFSSPLPLAALGIAYSIETTIADIEPKTPAARAGLQKGDVIKAVRFQIAGKKPPTGQDHGKPGDWIELKPNQWSFIFDTLQHEVEIKEITVRLERDNREVTVAAEEDKSWPQAYRGLFLQADKRLVRADSFGQALMMGTNRTYGFIKQIFGNLRSMIRGRVSPKIIAGPVGLANAAFYYASDDIYQFLVFLGIISVNLAVVNFLPIPVLDGGHMVFLAYEAIVRKPAPEKVLTYALIVGVTLLISIMVFVTYLDLGGR